MSFKPFQLLQIATDYRAERSTDARSANGGGTDRVVVFPSMPDLKAQIEDWNPAVLDITFTRQPVTTYTLTLLAGAKDRYGNASKGDYTFSFKTSEDNYIASRATPIISGDLMVTSAYRENTHFAMLVSSKPTVDFELYRVLPQDLSMALLDSATYGVVASYFNHFH